jgi:transketolase
MYNDKYLIPEWRTPPLTAGRDGVGEGLLAIGGDEKVVVLTANLAESTRVSEFGKIHPTRFWDVGVAEQNLVGVAAGMALSGLIPFASSFATFSPGRSWEQVRVSVSMTRANVKLIGGHGGASVGENGPSHQALEDIALMRVLPNMTVLVPADSSQTAQAIISAYKHEGPVYIRTTRPKTANFIKSFGSAQEKDFEIGKIYKYREISPSTHSTSSVQAGSGRSVTLIACGIQVWDALMVAERLFQEGVECEVLNASTIKPFDEKTLLASVAKTKRVVTIEDHQVAGGLGSVVAEVLSEKYPVPLKRIGVRDRFGISANWESVYKELGLDQDNLYREIKAVVA